MRLFAVADLALFRTVQGNGRFTTLNSDRRKFFRTAFVHLIIEKCMQCEWGGLSISESVGWMWEIVRSKYSPKRKVCDLEGDWELQSRSREDGPIR